MSDANGGTGGISYGDPTAANGGTGGIDYSSGGDPSDPAAPANADGNVDYGAAALANLNGPDADPVNLNPAAGTPSTSTDDSAPVGVAVADDVASRTAAVATATANLNAVSAALDAAAAATSPSAANVARVAQWHQGQANWISIGAAIADGSNPRIAEWSKIGRNMGTEANAIATLLNDSTVSGRVRTFLLGMPGALYKVSTSFAGGVGNVLGFGAGLVPWPIWAAVAAVGLAGSAYLAFQARAVIKAAVPA